MHSVPVPIRWIQLSMTIFEPRILDVGSDRSTKCATATALYRLFPQIVSLWAKHPRRAATEQTLSGKKLTISFRKRVRNRSSLCSRHLAKIISFKSVPLFCLILAEDNNNNNNSINNNNNKKRREKRSKNDKEWQQRN